MAMSILIPWEHPDILISQRHKAFHIWPLTKEILLIDNKHSYVLAFQPSSLILDYHQYMRTYFLKSHKAS